MPILFRTLLVAIAALSIILPSAVDAAHFFPVGDLPGGEIDTLTTDISDDGSIVVGFGQSDAGTTAFRWTEEGGIEPLLDSAGEVVSSLARAVTNDGIVATQLDPDLDPCTPGQPHPIEDFGSAALWTDGIGFEQLGGNTFIAHDLSSDGNFVAGTDCTMLDDGEGGFIGVHQPFFWSRTTGLFLLGHGGQALGISEDGTVLTGQVPFEGANQSFVWTEATGTFLLTLPDDACAEPPCLPAISEASDINSGGDIVVGTYTLDAENQQLQAFRWTPDDAMVALGNAQFTDTQAFDLSADGNVIGGEGFVSLDGTGDFNSSGQVEQGDLDLVLLNWGEDGTTPPENWVADLPTETIDQGELDSVLLNWGNEEQLVAATLWQPETGTRDLRDVLIEAGLEAEIEGWTFRRVNGVSEDGLSLVGFGNNPNGDREGFVIRLDPPMQRAAGAVPEPGSLWLVVAFLACGVLFLYPRRRC